MQNLFNLRSPLSCANLKENYQIHAEPQNNKLVKYINQSS